MKLSDFDYELPKSAIAEFPPQDRPSARLLKVEKSGSEISHHQFRDIVHFLRSGDLLVLNNTKVIPARIYGTKQTGGRVEALLLHAIQEGKCEVLLRPGGRIKKGSLLTFGDNGIRVEAKVLDDARPDSAQRLLEFPSPSAPGQLKEIGHMPLPPYIDRADTAADREHYQTVYAEKEGAVAAPTAGLHFDKILLEQLEKADVEICYVTLHTGYGTFQSINVEDLSQHQMFEEAYEISKTAADQINKATAENRRIIACGTTSVRCLEAAVIPHPNPLPQGEGRVRVNSGKGTTRLFVYPPYEFKMVSGLITNFHLPKSTLLLLVAAFLGSRDRLFEIYAEAIRKDYRFYSYGDAMVIL